MLSSLFLRMAYLGSEWVLWLLILLSFVSVGLIVERILYYRAHKVDETGRLAELLQAGDLRGAWQMTAESESIDGIVIAAGLQAIKNGTHACTESMAGAKARERTRLDASLGILATIGANAPFIGLLGTVLGIIKAARELSSAGGADAVLAAVFEALVATAVGLFVAIPAVVAYNLFQRKVKTMLAHVDSLAHLLLANMKSSSTRSSSAAAAQPAQVQ